MHLIRLRKIILIKHPFVKANKVAGRDWLERFLKRNPEISVRKPQPTSINKLAAFNKDEVSIFFSKLTSVMAKYNFTSARIFNADEMGITNAELAINGFRATGTYPVNRNVFQDHDFIDEDLPAIEESCNDPPRDIMTPVDDNDDNCLPEAGAVEALQPQSVNEPPSTPTADRNHHANPQTKEPTTTMDDSLDGPSTSSTYLSPKVLQPIPRLKKTASYRGRKATKPMILTSSPYKRFRNIGEKEGRNKIEEETVEYKK